MDVNLSSQELKLITRQGTRALIVSLVVCLLTLNTTDNAQAAPGDLDLSFNSDGSVITDIGTGADEARALAIQSDGKIVVAGRSEIGGQFDIAVVRYNTNGSLDTSFGTGGIVTTAIDPGTGADDAYGVAIQSSGEIVVVGRTQSGGPFDIAVVRYNADGSLDTNFGTGGIVTTPIDVNNGDDEAYGVALQSDGKIVVAGRSEQGGTSDIR